MLHTKSLIPRNEVSLSQLTFYDT